MMMLLFELLQPFQILSRARQKGILGRNKGGERLQAEIDM
jgi:hypothetical protein